MWTFSGGAYNNRNYFSKKVQNTGLSDLDQMLLYDPQTSGGLLIAVPQDKMNSFQREAPHMGVEVWQIGEMQANQLFKLS